MNYTPGIWETPGTENGERVLCAKDKDGKRRTIAHVYGRNNNDIERDANAALISAAPELLEALKAIVIAVRPRPGEVNMHPEVLKNATRAILKAEGN